MECAFEKTVDLPNGGFMHTKCVSKAEILTAGDPCYGLCYQCAYDKLQAENEQLEALCWRESQVLKEALKRKDNKSMIAVVADSLEKQASQEKP